MKKELLPYVVERLRSRKFKHVEIAKATGVPYSTISKISQGYTPNPGVLTVQALANYFSEAERNAGRR